MPLIPPPLPPLTSRLRLRLLLVGIRVGLHGWPCMWTYWTRYALLALHVDLLYQVRLVGPVDLLEQVRLIGPVDLLEQVRLIGPVHGPILVQHAQWGE